MLEYGPRPHVPLSEVEVFVGNILGKNGVLTSRQREIAMSMKERFEDDLGFIVRCIANEPSPGEEDEQEGESADWAEQSLELSMACLWVGFKESAKLWELGKRQNVELRSFGYVAAAVCLKEVERLVGCS